MAPKTKKEVEIPAFDLRKPDLSPIDRKLAQGDDETTLSEAFQMMVYVPHTDGYRDKLIISGSLEKAATAALSHPSLKVRLCAVKAAAYFLTWEKEVARFFRREEMALASVRLIKECMDALYDYKETGGANVPVDPKAKKGGGPPPMPFEATADGAECALRAAHMFLLVFPGTARPELLRDRTLEDILDIARQFEDPTCGIKQRTVSLLYSVCGFSNIVHRLLVAGLLPFLWAQATAEAQGVDARAAAMQCLQLVVATCPAAALQLDAMLQPTPDEAAGPGRSLVSSLLDLLLVREPLLPLPAPVKGMPPPEKAPEAPRDPEREALKGAAAALLAAVLSKSPGAAREVMHVGGDDVLRALLPQPPLVRAGATGGSSGAAEEGAAPEKPTTPEGFRAETLLLPPDRPATSFVAHASALAALASALRLPDLRAPFLLEEAHLLDHLAWQATQPPPPPVAPVQPAPGTNTAPPVAKRPILEHVLFLLSAEAAQPISVQIAAAQLMHSLTLDPTAARRLLHHPEFLPFCKLQLAARAAAHVMLGTHLLSALALTCHQADRRLIEEKGYGDVIIEVAKAVGPGASPVLRHALGQCVMVINPEYPLRPSSLAAFSAPQPPSFLVPPLWDILADVSLAER